METKALFPLRLRCAAIVNDSAALRVAIDIETQISIPAYSMRTISTTAVLRCDSKR